MTRVRSSLAASLLAGAALLCSPSQASVGEIGFGSRSVGMAGNQAAWGFDSFAAYSNPAGLPWAAGKKASFGYGWTWLDPKFTPIENITIENAYTSDQERTGSVREDYKSTLGQTIGGAALLAPEFHSLSAGIALYTPYDPLALTDTGETFIPEYVLYRARAHRPQIDLGVAMKPTDRLSLGLSMHMGFGITANGTAFLQTQAGTTSTMRVTASLKPQTSPNAAWLLLSEKAADEAGSWSLGQVIRLPNSSDATLAFNSSARAFGSLAALDINFGAAGTMFYDPLSIETGFSWRHSPRGRLSLQADFQDWTKFKRPALKIDSLEDSCSQSTAPGANCDPLLVNTTTLPSLPLRRTWTARLAEEVDFGRLRVRLGYAFRQGIFSALPTGSGNYLDPDKHSVTAGMGWSLNEFLGWQVPTTIDLHVLWQKLASGQVTKTALNEAGNSGTKIGSPGYSVGGQLWGAGASINLAL